MGERFHRDRLTWVAYVVLAWFAYLQAAPGLVIVHLREELDLSYSTGGLHVAAFADHHGDLRTVALAEENLAASIAYVVLIGVLSLTAALHAGWRAALLASLAVPVLAWWSNRHLAIDAPPPSRVAQGRLPGRFWIAAAMLFGTTAAEGCITAWGTSFVEDAAGATTDTAVTLMGGYFGGVLAGRTLGSRLARRQDPARLLALALAVAAAGFAILWPSTGPAQALVGLSLLGIGLGNLFPMGVSVVVALAPDRAVLASGRAVAMSSFAVVLAPLTVGTLADATSLKAALWVVPVALMLAGAGLALVRRARTPASAAF